MVFLANGTDLLFITIQILTESLIRLNKIL